MSNDIKISVLICTKNRYSDLVVAVKSILNNSIKPLEIIIIDQSTDCSCNDIQNLNKRLIKYYRNNSIGLSAARNFGVGVSSGNVIAFTDDDCIASKNWLLNIYKSFKTYKNIAGMTGATIGYKKTKKSGKRCPSTFNIAKKEILIRRPGKHWEKIGLGNNMAFYRDTFHKFGLFNKYLGVGSIGKSAEDGEYLLRLLISGQIILHSPRAIIMHNRWLDPEDWKEQMTSYLCGEIACYGYFSLKGFKFAKKVVNKDILNVYWVLRKSVSRIIRFRREIYMELYYALKIFIYAIRGILVSVIIYLQNLYYSIRKMSIFHI